ncbi:Gfo/Idh/MocA family protein [Stratiformator vulcanicus]|uniref:Glucose--fructose oxidoreductase n=1 Tax=Stratiformator vulcanicus TaxID=2527980 RepID=A0A517QZD2_9PLAN|nr:Gfo/Idh/MocA family oxidoreductase [Stratiformator vulcanicus]QDT36991.1 Glucose--fructose oxidoreductase precursor [Stratiformator vulcanicus]
MNGSTDQPEAKPVSFGVLGTGRIATKVGAAIRGCSASKLEAVASRSEERARSWADENKAGRSFDSYDALLDDPAVEAVYIALPPSLHREWTIAAAERGKHVLCEKPLAMNAAEGEEMIAACAEAGVQLMDGVMWLHTPRARDMRNVLDDELLGPIRRVTSAFTFHGLPGWEPATELRLRPESGGGSLFDLGWYNVGVSLWAFGKLPERVWATARFEHGVDVEASGVMWFEGGGVASFDCGFDTAMRKWFEAGGTHASLICDDFVRAWKPEKPRFWIHDSGGKSSEHISESSDQIEDMVADFCQCVRDDLDPRWGQISLQTQRVVDALLESARRGETIDLG